MNETLREPACAKVNLNLAVVGRDAAGYHLLETLMAFADGAQDMLTLERRVAGGDTLDAKGAFAARVPCGPDNLVLRATSLVRERAPSLPTLGWTLDKILPVAAGIGGGSADTGAALRLMGRAFDVDRSILEDVARELGADVPAAFHDQATWATGRGEVLLPVALPPTPAILVNPGITCETPAVFRAYREAGGAFSRSVPARSGWAGTEPLPAWCAAAGNDLLTAARTVVPDVANVLAAIAACEACRFAGMSGSGATCFGLFDDAEEASHAANALAEEQSAWWVRAVTIR